MEKRQQGTLGRTLGAFALGATAGGILALLFAPADGRTTRRRIAQKVRELKQTSKEFGRAATKRISYARSWVLEHMPNGHVKRPVRRHAVHHA